MGDLRRVIRSCLLFAVCAASLVTSAPAQASLPDLHDAGIPGVSQPQAPKPAIPASQSSSNTASAKVLAAPANPSVILEALSSKVAPGGQAIFRATATTGVQAKGVKFDVTLPSGYAFNRTLGVMKNNEAQTSTFSTTGTPATNVHAIWQQIASTTSVMDAGQSMEVIFVATAPALPLTLSASVSVTSDQPTATDTESITVTNTALTIELDDSPFSAGDSNNVGTNIPSVATIGARIVNPTASAITATVNIGNGTTPGTFPGASGSTCTALTGGLAMLALENHGTAGAAADAARVVTVPANGVKSVFYSLCYPAGANTFFQNRAFTVWTTAAGSVPANGQLISQADISASANKILSISGGRVGDVITETVNFDLGQIGVLGSAWLQGAGTYGYDPTVARLRTVQASLNNVSQVANRAYFVGLSNSVTGTVTYTYDAIGFGTTSFAPYQFAASGQPLKYTGNFGSSETILTPPSLDAVKAQRKLPDGTFTTDNITVAPGDTIEYRITVSNSGQQAATGVNVSDPIPANTTYVAGSANLGGALNIAGTEVDWTNKTVPAASSLVFTFQVTVNGTVPFTFQVTNTAHVSSSNGGSPDSNPVVADGQGTVDLGITKDCPGAVVLGETATYTLHYSNTGTSDASGVTITDTLSAGQSYNANSATNGAGEPAITNGGLTLTWNIGSLAAGASSSFSFDVTIATDAPSQVTDQASISGNEADANQANNTSTLCSVPVTAPDLHIAKTCPPAPVLGEQASYTITYSNNGSASDSGVTIVDTLGPNQTFDSATGDFNGEPTVDGNTITFDIGNLAANSDTFSITVTVNVTGTGSLSNSVEIAGQRAERSTTTADNTASCSSTVTYADLFVNKVCPTSGLYGDDITYSVEYGNLGTASAPGTVLTDVLSAGQSYNGDASVEPYSVTQNEDGTTTIVWHLDELAAGAGGTITFTAHVTDTGDVSNSADIAGSRTEHDATENNNHSACGTSVTHVDLFINKACPTAPVLDEDAEYTITYGNNGSAEATVVRITDVLPAGQTYVPGSTTGAGEPQQDGQELTFSVANVAAGDTDNTLTFKVHVDQVGTLANSATISSHEADGNPSDNTGSCTSDITQPDLFVAKTCPAAAEPGETFSDSITYGNNGSASDSGVTITLVLGDGLSFVDSSTPHSVDGQTVTFNIGDLAATSGDLTVNYTVKVRDTDTAGTHSLTQAVSIDGDRTEPTSTLADNAANCATPVTYTPDLFIHKTCPGTVVLGEDATYTIDYGNSGTAPSNGVVITDTLGDGQEYVAGSTVGADEPDVTGNVLTFSVGTVNPNGSQTQSFSFKVHVTSAGSISNSAAIAGNEAETQTDNNTSGCDSTVTQPDLTIQKECPATAEPGATVEHTLTYGNPGSADALDVVISDDLGTGLTFVDSDAPHSVSGQHVTFNVGTIPAGTTGLTITYTVKIADADDAGTHVYTDTASIAGSRTEVVTDNNSDGCETSITFRPDLQIAKDTSDANVAPGSLIHYTITVTNPDATSSAPATGTTVSDTLPEGTTFDSCGGGTSCSNTDGTVTWTIGTVDVGQSFTLTLTVKVGFDAGCQICNTASVSSPDDPDSPVASAPACIGTTPQGNPANANATGNAFGVSASLLGAEPIVIAPVNSAQHGIGTDAPDAAEVLPIAVPNVGTADVITSTSSSDVNASLRNAHTTATSTTLGVNLLDGAITATLVRASSGVTTTESGLSVSALGSTIENLQINGVAIDDVTPNKRVALTDADGNTIGYVVLFEQLTSTDTPDSTSNGTYEASLTVNMIHVFLGVIHPLGDGPGTEIIVSSATAASDYPQAELCSQGSARTTNANAFAVHAVIPSSDGPIVEILTGASGPIPPSGGHSHHDLIDFVTQIAKGASESDAIGSTGNPVTANAFDEVTSLNLLDGTITASLLRSQSASTAGPGGASSTPDGSKFVSLSIDTGGDEPQTFENMPEANDKIIEIPDVGFVILNEQLVETGNGSSGLTVTSIHLVVTLQNVLGLPIGTEIWVSQAHTAAEFILPS